MPITDIQKRQLVVAAGYDPNSYTTDEEGDNLIPIQEQQVFQQPTAGPQVITPKPVINRGTPTTPNPVNSPLSTFTKSIAQAAPTAAAFGAGAGGAMLMPWAHVAPPWSELAFGLIGGSLAGLGVGKAQEVLEPDAWKQNVAQAQIENPKSALAGELAALTLGGFSPSPTRVVKAVGTAGKLAAALGDTRGVATAKELANLSNVGIGAGLSGVMGQAQRMIADEPTTIGDVFKDVGIGAFFNNPNAIGRNLYGFKGDSDIFDLNEKLREYAALQHAKPGEAPAIDPAIPGKTPGFDNRLIELNSRDLLQMLTGTTRNRKLEVSPAKKAADVAEIFKQKFIADEAQAKLLQEKKLADFLAAQKEIRDQEIKLANEARVVPPKTVPEEVRNWMESDTIVKKPKAESFIPADYIPSELKESSSSKLSESGEISTQFEKELLQKLEQGNYPTRTTKAWWDMFKEFAIQLKGISVDQNGIPRNAKGEPVAGQTLLEEGLPKLLKINVKGAKNKAGERIAAGADTYPHELFHAFVASLRKSQRPRDVQLVNRYDELVSNSPDYNNWKLQREAKGQQSSPEEYAATNEGYEFLNRHLNMEGEKPLKTWWKDFSTYLKTRYTKHATEADYRRLFNYRLLYDRQRFPEYWGDKSGKILSPANVSTADKMEAKNQENLPGFDDNDVKVNSALAKMKEAIENPRVTEEAGREDIEWTIAEQNDEFGPRKKYYSESDKSKLEGDPVKQANIVRRYNEIIRDMRTRGYKSADIVTEAPGYVVSYSNHSNNWYTGPGAKRNKGEEINLGVNQIFVPGNLNEASFIADNLPSHDKIFNASVRGLVNEVTGKKDITPENLLPDVTEETSKILDEVNKPQLGFSDKQKRAEIERDLQRYMEEANKYPDDAYRVDYFTKKVEKEKAKLRTVDNKQFRFSDESKLAKLKKLEDEAIVMKHDTVFTDLYNDFMKLYNYRRTQNDLSTVSKNDLTREHFAEFMQDEDNFPAMKEFLSDFDFNNIKERFDKLVTDANVAYQAADIANEIERAPTSKHALNAEGSKLAPAEFAHYWPKEDDANAKMLGIKPKAFYHLIEDIEGHPKGSTVTEDTLRKAGYDLPDQIKESEKSKLPQTETPEFKNWFGKSKIVDENGNPLVIYHGTSRDKNFTRFNENMNGIWLTRKPEQASMYAKENDSRKLEYKPSTGYVEKNTADRVFPLFAKIENPLILTVDNPSFKKWRSSTNYKKASQELVAFARAEGYDGIEFPDGNTIVAFKSNQLKSSTGNDGTFDPSNPDIRESALSKLNPYNLFKPEIEKIRDLPSPDSGKVADAFTEFYRNWRGYSGKFSNKIVGNLLQMLNRGNLKQVILQNSPAMDEVVKWYWDKQAGRTPQNLSPQATKIQQLVAENMKDTWDEMMAFPALAQKHKAQDPNYLPHIPARTVLHTLLNKSNTPEARKLIADWHNYYTTQLKKSKAVSDENLAIFMGAYDKQQSDLAQQFGPIDKLAGLGLPESWREKNLVDIMFRFNNRYGRRLAYYKAVEQNPDVIKALSDPENGIGRSDVVQNVSDDIAGVREHSEANRTALIGLWRALQLGPLTGAKDFVSNLVLGAQHQTLPQAILSPLKAWSEISKNIAESFEMGVNRHNIAALELPENGWTEFSNIIRRVRDISTVASGRNILERVTRATAFGQGKFIAMSNLQAAKRGKIGKQETKFLDDFGPKDWRKYVSEGQFPPEVLKEIAARYVESVQGTYDYRGLPSIAMKGTLSPYLSLARWNIEKMNNFKKYVVEPATKGNLTPLLMSTVGMLIGGEAVTKLVETATGRKEKTVNLTELKDLYDENEPMGGPLGYKMAALASMAGYGGIVGDITRAGLDWHNKNNAMTYGNPLISGLTTMTQNLSDIVEAAKEGNTEITLDAVSQFTEDMVQAYRIGLAQLNDEKQEKLEKGNKMRDLKVFKQSRGLPVGNPMKDRPNPFLKREEREFKETDDISKAAGMLPSLITRAFENADGNFEQLKANLNGLKINSYQTMPNPNTMPQTFLRYLNFLSRTQGADEASKRLIDYMTQNTINRAKSQLVPKL